MSLKIDVEDSFKRVDDPPVKQPPDYTSFPSGDIRVYAPALRTGVISQEGLNKRLLDAKVITDEQRQNWVVNGSMNVKPIKNVGVLSYVDNFFLWLNKVLGS